MKDALKTEVAKTPRFVVNIHKKPYMFKGDGLTEGVDKVYLPRDIRKDGALESTNGALRKNYTST